LILKYSVLAEAAAVRLEGLPSSQLRGFLGGSSLLRPALSDIAFGLANASGALPSVLGGLVSRPIIAVPTSVGYGANFGGLSALLTMLNSCASGVTVVNIDNGFGAGYAASQINALVSSK
jgi:NCAIR mutase (PurE)-related protein